MDVPLTPTEPANAEGSDMTSLNCPLDDLVYSLADQLRRDLSLLGCVQMQKSAAPESLPSCLALTAPRRKSRDETSRKLAVRVAELLIPTSLPGSLSSVIKYEKSIVQLRAYLLERSRNAHRRRALDPEQRATWAERIRTRGPWDEETDASARIVPRALPMPVKVSDADSLQPFFDFLESNITPDHHVKRDDMKLGAEPLYDTPLLEFQKGVVYDDFRMDLCKKVVGPVHISRLMDALDHNTHITHFLLGNNIIGPTGARRIASFIRQHPEQMGTWYLAGNCIDTMSFRTLVDALVHSKKVSSIWLKRNPLTRASASAVAELVTRAASLRTLDLDQTELSDEGIAQLFGTLAEHPDILPLRHLYLNGNGAGYLSARAIADFLVSPRCRLESLFIAVNPLGDRGAIALSKGLSSNLSLRRLVLSSCGMKSAGAIAIATAAAAHPALLVLDMGQAFSTLDLQARFNFIDDDATDALRVLLAMSPSLRYFDIGQTAMSERSIDLLATAAAESRTLVFYEASSFLPNGPSAAQHKQFQDRKETLRDTLARNVSSMYGMSYGQFLAGALRFLRNTDDIRAIDSVYRNRDMRLARRGQLKLEKSWKSEEMPVYHYEHISLEGLT